MAETGTRPEIEDVLSSIRRLVSEGVIQTPTPRGSDPGPLLLTPSQLISTDAAEPEPEVGAVAPLPDLADADVAKIAPERYEDLVSEPVPATGPSPGAPQDWPQDWEPDFDDSNSGEWPQEAEVKQPNEIGAELHRLEDTIAQIEAAVAGSEAAFEPERGDTFDARAKMRFVPIMRPAQAPEQAGFDVNEGTSDDPIEALRLNEAELQRVIAQMVRKELQGELGVRITRNLRKLVRREIARALMSRDLE